MNPPLLVAESVVARYGQVAALHGLDFVIDEGEIVVILGANGAGKTTTLRSICGMVRTSGTIRFAGRDLVGLRPDKVARLGISHVPQGRGTFAELTVLANLEAGAYLRRDRRGVEEDLRRWLGTFPVLGQRRDRRAGELSGGEQQMLAIARALMARPRLLLLDEPSLGLAPLIVQQLFQQLATLNRTEGVTMLVVEQNAALALGIADRGYILETGSFVMSGRSAQLTRDDTVRRAYLGG